jgi:opacity protein-like surface antigen
VTADRGDLGYTAGLFGGYGAQVGNFYLGGELEAELAKTHSNNEREGGGRSFSLEKQWSYGASLRAGYAVNNTALLYARVGVVQTRFDVDFARGNNSLSAQYTKTGLRYGGGMEFPAANDLIVRLDYTHTSYPEFSLVTPPAGEVERYRPKEDLFRLGVLRQFSAK